MEPVQDYLDEGQKEVAGTRKTERFTTNMSRHVIISTAFNLKYKLIKYLRNITEKLKNFRICLDKIL